MNFILKHKLILIGICVGAILGFAYYYFIGCTSGSCAITSKPLNSTVYGAIIGALAFSGFKNQTNK
ncbi:MAG: hypothetical protein JSR09_05650 [Bacteroidetes bacterium]|nr:hypothetical protein [Bacteroidota bacterium]MBS1649173.1 hypothetical protein [Bacteroidota bacterium]